MNRKFELYPLFIIICFIGIIFAQAPMGDVVSSNAGSISTANSDIGDASATAISNSQGNNVHLVNINNQMVNPALIGSGFVDQTFPSPLYTINKIGIIPTEVSGSSIVVGKCQPMKWTSTKLQAIDISVSPQGDLYGVGANRQLYQYNFLTNTWGAVTTDADDIINITRVSVSYDGTPFIITASGETYYNNCNRDWVRLSGCAIDLAIGRGGDIFKIGCDQKADGFSVYKLICRDEEGEKQVHLNTETCNRSKQVWKCHGCNKKKEKHNCSWFKLSGAGVRIAVNSNGSPIVIKLNGDIISYDNDDWVGIGSGVNARDIDVSNEGEVYYIDDKNQIFKVGRQNIIPKQVCGSGKGITVGAFGHPFIIGNDFSVLSSAKHCYN